MKMTTCIIYIAMLAMPLTASATDKITQCDIEAGHPSDPNHVGEGKLTEDVDTAAGIVACREAVSQYPEVPRFHYQLARSLVYAGKMEEGLIHLTNAADMKYVQAQFVLGLLTKGKDVCGAEKLTKTAADQGLKSARITYVNDVLGNVYKGCKLSAGNNEMSAYLDAAGSQMSGYYEAMLLNILKRELQVMISHNQ